MTVKDHANVRIMGREVESSSIHEKHNKKSVKTIERYSADARAMYE